MSAARVTWSSVAVVVLAGCVALAVLGLRPREAAPRTVPEASTTTVERGDLVETQTIDGEIGYGPATPLPSTLPGTVTALPAPGSTIGRDQRLYAIDARAVILLIGDLPAWRTLEPGISGSDVRQLERNLAALGYDDFRVDNNFTSATAEAVRDWQEKHGLLETGVIELGRVVFWPRPMRVEDVEAVPGQAIAVGDVVLNHTATARNVYADLDVTLAGLARSGASVQVSLPDRPPIAGRISAVGTAIEEPSASGGEDQSAAAGEPTIALTIAIADQTKLGSITGAPVEVRLTGDRRNDVLTVPVAALLALREGGHGLEIVAGTSRRVVAVETGLFAAGRVEVAGPGLAEGTIVAMAAS